MNTVRSLYFGCYTSGDRNNRKNSKKDAQGAGYPAERSTECSARIRTA